MNEPRVARDRLLHMCARLIEEHILYNKKKMEYYDYSLRSIQHDFDDLHAFFTDRNEKNGTNQQLIYDWEDNGCRLLTKLVDCSVPVTHQKQIAQLIANETYQYMEPHYKKPVLNTMWTLSSAVCSQLFVNITYIIQKNSLIKRKIKLVGILFSEFYFYLIAFIDSGESAEFYKTVKDYALPAIYCIDRIQRFDMTEDHFRVVYANRFEKSNFASKYSLCT